MFSVTNHSRYLASHLDPARAGHTYAVMKKRPLGATGLTVGELGLGTAGLGKDSLPDHEAIFAISQSMDMQASLIDVAPSYGRALLRVGRALAGRRSSAQVCLKAGYEADGSRDYSPRGLRASLERSLKALGTGHVDVLLLHNPPAAALAAADPAWAELAKLKAEGKVRAYGVSLTGSDEAKAALEKTPAEVLELPFNVFCQDNAVVFDAAAKKRVGLIVNRPLDSGWLAGRYGAHHLFFDERKRWSGADKARRASLQQAFEALAATAALRPSQAALEFVLSFPQVSCAVVGASSWKQVIDNVSADQRGLDPGVVAKLRDLWDKQLKSSPVGL
jgi:aryl-alcohol dehydrogenase-like predicted oxidoreductase